MDAMEVLSMMTETPHFGVPVPDHPQKPLSETSDPVQAKVAAVSLMNMPDEILTMITKRVYDKRIDGRPKHRDILESPREGGRLMTAHAAMVFVCRRLYNIARKEAYEDVSWEVYRTSGDALKPFLTRMPLTRIPHLRYLSGSTSTIHQFLAFHSIFPSKAMINWQQLRIHVWDSGITPIWYKMLLFDDDDLISLLKIVHLSFYGLFLQMHPRLARVTFGLTAAFAITGQTKSGFLLDLKRILTKAVMEERVWSGIATQLHICDDSTWLYLERRHDKTHTPLEEVRYD